MRPLAIDLFCGLGGWTEGLLAEGYDVVGFDIERHDYGSGSYPAQLVLQNVLTLHGKQFRDAALLVASPPCQEYSYMAMPWSRAKAIAAEYRSGRRDVKQLTALFDACFRIQREAIEAAGHFIPLVVENVRGAIPWVGRSRWNYGSYHLWGDVPALMPMTKTLKNISGGSWFGLNPDGSAGALNNARDGQKFNPDGTAHPPGSWFAISDSQKRGWKSQAGGEPMRRDDGTKQPKSGRAWFADPDSISGATSSKSNVRKAASAMIARIPFPLARHIAAYWKPR